MAYIIKVSKILSRNDTGETHSHQSGIAVGKQIGRSGVFPEMPTNILNPRTNITFLDVQGNEWEFPYIYYNDRYFGKPAGKWHDEYRLTCVKDFIRLYDLKSGDAIWFAIDEHKKRYIGFDKQDEINNSSNDGIIHVCGKWKIINY